MEEMKTKKRCYLITVLDLIIAYGTFSGVTIVKGFQEVRQKFLHMLASLLQSQSHVHDSIVHKPTSQRNVLVSKYSRDNVCLSVVASEKKLRLDEIEDVLTALDSARHPTFPDLYLVLTPSKVYLASRIFDCNLVSASHDLEVDLGCLDLKGAVRKGYYFLDDSATLKGDI